MSESRGSIHCNLIEEQDEGDCRGPDVPYTVFKDSVKRGKGLCQEPFKLVSGCLAGICLVLLIVLLVTNTHTGKGSSAQQSEAEMQKSCPNVTALTIDLQMQMKAKGELEKEVSVLKGRIARLEAASAPAPVPTKSPCAEDWKFFNGSCYFISGSRRSWDDSEEYCQNNGGHLAIILTPEEQTFIWDLLPRGHWNAYWFGISDEKVEEDWHWVDGTKLVGGFWEEGEPNNHFNEDCGYMIKTDVLTRVAIKSWYDAPCHMYLPWICEKLASS
ncbi:hypothetical protein DNTS_035656 [Danionella cerebrum]|uniref:C-type lectin domain-containing protein n=1 Tax=Danionella cerebrum TaxID=2873325 RepID=A0A553QXT8_9TELE|nr:hypothetical protein DNTS_035656 [Danionella translucida]